MAQLSHSDLQATLGFLGEATAVTGPDPFPSELLDRLRDLVECDWVTYEELDHAADCAVAYEACARGRELDASLPPELHEAFWGLEDRGPHCAYMNSSDDRTAHKLSDFVTRSEWHRHEAYAEYFRFIGLEDMLWVGLPTLPSHSKLFFVNRSGNRDFDERDRLLLNRLLPHLSALDLAAGERRLAAALRLDQERTSLVVLRSSDQLEFATPAAERLLDRYFPATADSQLPEPVRAWLHSGATRLNGDGLPHPAHPSLEVVRDDRRLTIRKAGSTLLLNEEIAVLTRREREIVDALADGCSNTEIADRLTIAPTTVRKHLENIYAKLGVNNRTAAVAATSPHSESDHHPRSPSR